MWLLLLLCSPVLTELKLSLQRATALDGPAPLCRRSAPPLSCGPPRLPAIDMFRLKLLNPRTTSPRPSKPAQQRNQFSDSDRHSAPALRQTKQQRGAQHAD